MEQDIQDLKDCWRDASLGPSTEAIVKEAERRGIPWMPLSARFLIQVGYGVHQKRMQATMTDNTGILGVELACDKEATKRILANSGVPVPKGTVINFLDDLEEAIDYVGGYPIVIKPLDGIMVVGLPLILEIGMMLKLHITPLGKFLAQLS